MAWTMENAVKEVCVVGAWRQQIAITKAEEVWHIIMRYIYIYLMKRLYMRKKRLW